MLRNPFEIVRWFEEEIAHYTGAPYAIATNSCTNAIFLACKHLDIKDKKVTIPKRTYLSVPQSIMQAGGKLEFADVDWKGLYQLKPFPIYDSAKRLTSNMYMTPEQAARGMILLSDYPENAEDQIENPPYRDLTEFDLFK